MLSVGWQSIVVVAFLIDTSSTSSGSSLDVALRRPGGSDQFVTFGAANGVVSRTKTDGPGASGAAVFLPCTSCNDNLDTIFLVDEDTDDSGGATVLSASAFRSICAWEDRLLSDAGVNYQRHCATDRSGKCCAPQSVPRMLSTALGTPCSSLTDEQLAQALQNLQTGALAPVGFELDAVRDGFLDMNWEWGQPTSSAKVARSMFCFNRATYKKESVGQRQGTAMGNAMEEQFSAWIEDAARDNDELTLGGAPAGELRKLVFNKELLKSFFELQLFVDLYLAVAAFCLLWVCLAFHTGSVCLAVFGMLHIFLSVPISYGFYTYVLEFETFPYICLIGVFVVAGIGVDDIYVFNDAWRQSFFLLPAEADLATRLSFAYRRAASAMFITSLTTAASFLVNAISPIPPIRLFGIYMALLIVSNYILVITWYPLIQVIQHRCCSHRTCCCCCCLCHRRGKQPGPEVESGGTSEEVKWRRVEKCFHGCWTDAMQRLRWPLFLALFALGVVSGFVAEHKFTFATEEVRLLRSSHMFSQYLREVPRFRSSPHVSDRGMTMAFVWGVLPRDCETGGCYYDNADRGQLHFDPEFDPAQPSAQRQLLRFAEMLKTDSRIATAGDHPLEMFGNWLRTVGGEVAGVSCVPSCNCTRCGAGNNAVPRNAPSCSQATLPLPASQFHECFAQYLRMCGVEADPLCDGSGDSLWDRSAKSKVLWVPNRTATVGDALTSTPARQPGQVALTWEVTTNQVGGWSYYQMTEYYDGWLSLLNQLNDGAPASAGKPFFRTFWFSVKDLQENLASSALVAMGMAVCLTLLVLFVATRSPRTTLLATISIAGVLSCTSCALVLLGWELGIIESMCLAILIGISCDFVVHLAWAFVSAAPIVRCLCTRT
jgi:hypothetical protein